MDINHHPSCIPLEARIPLITAPTTIKQTAVDIPRYPLPRQTAKYVVVLSARYEAAVHRQPMRRREPRLNVILFLDTRGRGCGSVTFVGATTLVDGHDGLGESY